jgi:hypothetical protein
MKYVNGVEVRVGDPVLFGGALAKIETIIEGDDVASWGLDVPGFMLLCGSHRFFIEPGSASWEDVTPTTFSPSSKGSFQ